MNVLAKALNIKINYLYKKGHHLDSSLLARRCIIEYTMAAWFIV